MDNECLRSELAAGTDVNEGTGWAGVVRGLGLYIHSFPENNLKQKLLASLNSGWQILDLQIILCTFLYFETFPPESIKNLIQRWWLLA